MERILENLKELAATAADIKDKLPSTASTSAGGDQLLKDIINTVFYFIGILAVIMIIYGGIQYVSSAGDAGKVAKAKNIIIWSVAGLVVAIFAIVIINFVIGITEV